MAYWTDSLSDSHAQDVVNTTIQALDTIVQDPTRQPRALNLLDQNGRQRILEWNHEYQSPFNSTIHQLVERRVEETPDAIAIASWDGELTYSELDRLAGRLASYLRSLGVGPEATVPICFEKSRWAVVAILAVLKAGGAFVPLDPTHPLERIQMIVEQLSPQKVAIISPGAPDSLRSLFQNVVVLDANSYAQLPRADGRSAVLGGSPDDMAYILFTSGSTGQPKGVVLDHRAVCTSIRAHGRKLNFTKDSRVLQFSSYAFDASIAENITTLVHGGCVCIPSDTERTNDLSGVINRLRVNWAFLTPAVATMLEPSDIPTLRTFVVGGESIGHSVIKKWAQGSCQIFQVYGPTETCIACTSEDRTGKSIRPEIIGTAMGCSTWVVDQRDPNILVPVGAVGELLIQGPIQARGYLNDTEKTKRDFLTGLNWVPDQMKHERFYRSGDLVRYNDNGTLSFVKRKDTQVKIRGYRIELGEISHHIGASHEQLVGSLVLLGSAGKFSGKIIAVLAFRDLGSTVEQTSLNLLHKDDLIHAQSNIAEMQNFIAEKLPPYMRPFTMIAVNGLPMNTSGKIDARRVAAWVDNMDGETYGQILGSTETAAPEPSGELEKAIQTAVSQVVNLPIQQVAMNRSFTSLGGDSVAAMRLMTLCRRGDMSLSVQDILKSGSIAAMAAKAKRSGSGKTTIESPECEDVPFALSPIQKLFFSQVPEGENHYTKNILLQLRRPVSDVAITKALEQLVQRHSMLRARFQREAQSGEWSQTITSQVKESFHFSHLQLASWDEAHSSVAAAENCLDITHGPLLAVRQINMPNLSVIALVAHRLVVDLASCQTLLRELEQLLDGVSLSSTSPFSYREWVHKIETHNRESSWSPTALPFVVPDPDLAFWGMPSPRIDTHDVFGEFILDPSVTRVLLQEAKRAMSAELLDVLLAMAGHTFSLTFPDREMPAIHTENDCRTHSLKGAPVNNTVGLFADIMSLVVARGTDYLDSVRWTKDTRRAVLNSGMPYFTTKALSDSPSPKSHIPLVEIVLNYSDQFQQFERTEGLFEALPSSMGSENADDFASRFSLINLTAVVKRDALTVSWRYGTHIQQQDRIEKWLSLFNQALEDVAKALQQAHTQLTRCDVPLLPISHRKLTELNDILSTLSAQGARKIEDVYPLSPVQRGILLSQTKDASVYDNQIIWEINSTTPGKEVDVIRLRRAWDDIIKRHPMLRTVFVPSVLEDGFLDQVVLGGFHPPITHFTYDNEEEEIAIQQLSDTTQGGFDDYAPAYRVAMCSRPGSKVFVQLHISHALVDAMSMHIIVRDWSRAYADELEAVPGPSYSNYIAHIRQTSLEESLQFWTSHLKNITPCRLPRLTDGVKSEPRQLKHIELDIPFAAELRNSATHLGVSVASIFQLAWAMVLRKYTNSRDVSFGYVTSGRDTEIDGIQDAVGPFINILVSRVVFEDEATISSILDKLFSTYIESLPHQHVALGDIMHALKLGSEKLFNTGISFQKVSESSSVTTSQLSFEAVGGNGSTEVSSACRGRD